MSPNIRFESMPCGSLQCQSTIVWDEQTKSCAWIDPTDDHKPMWARIQSLGLTVKALLLTHGHADHAASTGFAAELSGLTPYMHPADNALFSQAPQYAAAWGISVPWKMATLQPLVHEQSIEISPNLRFQVLHTPGHTPGSVAFFCAEAALLISGDTLFCESIGRTDLPGGSFAQLERSLRDVLYKLPPETQVIPGHGPHTRIGHEMKHNPYVQG